MPWHRPSVEVLLKVIDHWFSEIHFFLFLISSNPNPSGKNVSSTPQSLFPILKMGNFQLQIAFPNTCLVSLWILLAIFSGGSSGGVRGTRAHLKFRPKWGPYLKVWIHHWFFQKLASPRYSNTFSCVVHI